MTSAFLFDLDGTLGNTLPLCVAAFREAIEPLARRQLSDAAIMATFGPSEEGTIRALIPEQFDAGVARYLEAYERLHDRWPEPFPGIRELLGELKQAGKFVGLVTGKGARSLAVTLRRYGFEGLFEAVRTGRPEGPVKEACIEDLLAKHALNRSETLYIGDTVYDIRASRACGIRVAAAAWAPTADAAALRALRPDACFETVGGFADAVRRGDC
jgi:phosphoglycolate phosphatase/pyrophosphatase PpaX